MIGMFPPGPDGRVEARSTSPWRSMIEDAREASFEELEPGDEKRLFYTRKPWKRVIVMFAGPFMNLVLAVAIFLGVAMTFGFQTQTTEVAGVQKCVIDQSVDRDACKKSDPVSPAQAAGLKKGDRIVAFDGQKVEDWATLSDRIRETIGPATITVQRDGREQTLHAVLETNSVAKKDSNGEVIPGKFVDAIPRIRRPDRDRSALLRRLGRPHGRHDRERRRLDHRPSVQDPGPVGRGVR